MMQNFPKTYTLAGLIFLISPLISALSNGLPLSFWPPFFCSMMFSLFPLRAAMKHFSFRLWLAVCSLSGMAGILFHAMHSPDIPILTSPLFLGFSACGLLLLLPPWIAVGRYVSAGPFLGLMWSCSLFLSVPLRVLLQNTIPGFLFLSIFLMMSGFLFISRRSPLRQLTLPPPHDFFGAAMVKTVVFFLCLLTSMGTALCILLPKAEMTSGHMLLLSAALAFGPVLTSYFTEKKGIYSSCILSIFLTEASLLLICSLEGSAALAAGGLFLCLAVGSVTVIMPVLSFYLCGRTGYIRGLTPLILCIPSSLLFSWPFWNMAARGELIQNDTAAFLFFLLLTSFLCIFFAWKRRFIILKNRRI